MTIAAGKNPGSVVGESRIDPSGFGLTNTDELEALQRLA